MLLNFTVETEDLWQHEEMNFEDLLTLELQKEVMKKCRKDLASDKFKTFSDLTADTIIADIKLRMENFLSEDVALTNQWGKPTFVGSIEDLIKKRLDETLLAPVDSQGNTLKGCTSSSRTWIEWKIEKIVEERIKVEVRAVERTITSTFQALVKKQLIEIKDNALKQQVDDAFTSILQAPKKGGDAPT